MIDFYRSWDDEYMGQLKYVRNRLTVPGVEEDAEVCVNLRSHGCAIYETRPDVCRNFSEYTCGDLYERDEVKLLLKKNGKNTLRIV
jgi:Fe-S-cluster containining protein